MTFKVTRKGNKVYLRYRDKNGSHKSLVFAENAFGSFDRARYEEYKALIIQHIHSLGFSDDEIEFRNTKFWKEVTNGAKEHASVSSNTWNRMFTAYLKGTHAAAMAR